MSRRALVALALAASQLLACSVIVSELELCSDDDDCQALSEMDGLGAESCLVYRCRDRKKGCEPVPRDEDEDSYPDLATCAEAGLSQELDCDDGAPGRNPGEEEVCDGLDNDCDQEIDEEALASHLKPPRAVAMRKADWLSYGEPVGENVPVALTTRVAQNYETYFYLSASDQQTGQMLQSGAFEPNCTDAETELTARCKLNEIAIATSSELLLTLGINVQGCAGGEIRVASSRMTNLGPALRWDGDSSGNSNLRMGIEGASCQGDSQLHAPSLALARQMGGPSTPALALWRALPKGASVGALLGLGLDVEGHVRVNAARGGPARLSEEDSPGVESAQVRTFGDGFLVAYDVPEGLELAFVSGLERGTAQAFAEAKRLRIARPSARYVALATPPAGGSERIGLAWRVRRGSGWSVRFAPVSIARGRLPAPEDIADFEVASAMAISEGPVLAHSARGFALDANGEEMGGWLVAWIEAQDGQHTLMAARVRAEGDARIEEPFELQRAVTLKHLFGYASENSVLGYGLVSGTGEEQQLNIGELTCEPAPNG